MMLMSDCLPVELMLQILKLIRWRLFQDQADFDDVFLQDFVHLSMERPGHSLSQNHESRHRGQNHHCGVPERQSSPQGLPGRKPPLSNRFLVPAN